MGAIITFVYAVKKAHHEAMLNDSIASYVSIDDRLYYVDEFLRRSTEEQMGDVVSFQRLASAYDCPEANAQLAAMIIWVGCNKEKAISVDLLSEMLEAN